MTQTSPRFYSAFTAPLLCGALAFSAQTGCDEPSAQVSGERLIVEESGQPVQAEELGWLAQARDPDALKSDDTVPRPNDDQVARRPIGVLGGGTHSLEAVRLTLIGSERNGLNYPRDLDFNPERPGELWVVNQRDDSAVIFADTGTDKQRSQKIIDPAADHFMEEVSSISFGTAGRFATCQESGNTYNNRAQPNLFMGPTLWPADLDVFGLSNRDAVKFVGYDLGSHLDMLHESPYCVGIEWAGDQAYWVFEGYTNSVALVDFRVDHGPGYDDHSDGVTMRYAQGDVQRVPGIPSHMAYDAEAGLLYIADTGNRRVGVLDVKVGGQEGVRLPVKEPQTVLVELTDSARVKSLEGTDGLLVAPSGIALHDGLLYVTDAGSGYIVAFTLTGEIVDWLDTGAPGLFGLTFDEAGDMYVVHGPESLLVKISVAE